MTQKRTRDIVIIGMMAAVIFAGNHAQIMIPLDIGGQTRIHMGTIFMNFAGFLLGGVHGGLSAAVGSSLFNLTMPHLVTYAPTTFAIRFLMVFVIGKIAYMNGRQGGSMKLNLVAAICGQVVHIPLFVLNETVRLMIIQEFSFGIALAAVTPRVPVSIANAVIGIAIAVPLSPVIRKALLEFRKDSI